MSSSTSEKGTNPKDLLGVQKPPQDLLPPAGQIYGAMAMRSGAIKYDPYNWRGQPVQACIYVGAIARHTLAYLDGEETCADSGVHHLGAIIAGASILADARETGNLIDNRPPVGVAGALIDRISAAIKASDKQFKEAVEAGQMTAQELKEWRAATEAAALAAVFATPTCDTLEAKELVGDYGEPSLIAREPNTGAALDTEAK